MNTLQIKDLNPQELTLAKRKPGQETGSHGKYWDVCYAGHRNWSVELPEMITPFGAGPSKMNPDKYYLTLSFEGKDDTGARGRRLRAAHAKLSAVDERIRELLWQNVAELYPKDKNQPEVLIRAKYKWPLVRPSVSQAGTEYPDVISLQLQRAIISKKDAAEMSEDQKAAKKKYFQHLQDTPSFLIDATGNPLNVTVDDVAQLIPRRSCVRTYVQPGPLHVSGSGYDTSWTWYMCHGAVTKREESGSKNILHPYDDDDDEDEETAATQTAGTADADEDEDEGVEVSDDDEE